MTEKINPRVADNDRDEITVTLSGRELRGWSYRDDNERRLKILRAHEYVEGWCDHRDLVITDTINALPVLGVLNIDNPHDPKNKNLDLGPRVSGAAGSNV